MPLASQDGKLIYTTVTEIVDGVEVEKQKLCSNCCTGICLYRADGLGTCVFYVTETEEIGGFESEAEAIESAEAATEIPPGYPECYATDYEIYQETDVTWAYIAYYRSLTYDDEGQPDGCVTDFRIDKKENCTGTDLEDPTWANDLPATHCRPSSAEDCTETTGVFCPGVDDCTDVDPAKGCPERSRRNPLP